MQLIWESRTNETSALTWLASKAELPWRVLSAILEIDQHPPDFPDSTFFNIPQLQYHHVSSSLSPLPLPPPLLIAWHILLIFVFFSHRCSLIIFRTISTSSSRYINKPIQPHLEVTIHKITHTHTASKITTLLRIFHPMIAVPSANHDLSFLRDISTCHALQHHLKGCDQKWRYTSPTRNFQHLWCFSEFSREDCRLVEPNDCARWLRRARLHIQGIVWCVPTLSSLDLAMYEYAINRPVT